MGITQQIGASSLIKPGVIDNTAARPASPYEGQVIFQKDTDQLLVWNGTAWVIPNSPAQNPTGLELIKTQTIGSGVSTVTVNDAFSATYDNYKIIINGGTSTTQDYLAFRLGASATGSYYGFYTYGTFSANTVYGAYSNNVGEMSYAGGADVNRIHMNLELQSPFEAKTTGLQATGVVWSANRGSSSYDHEIASSYSSFSIRVGSGTMTGGTISVYGFRK